MASACLHFINLYLFMANTSAIFHFYEAFTRQYNHIVHVISMINSNFSHSILKKHCQEKVKENCAKHIIQGLEGYFWEPGFHLKTVQDSGFGCTWEAGFTEIWNGM